MSSTASYSLASKITLNNGIQMPRIHLGVYMTSGRETESAVLTALQAGYLAVDSAAWYGNEAEVGRAMQTFLKSKENTEGPGLKREDLWFTTKLQNNESYDAARREIKRSIRDSGLGYLDLYLLHSPYGGKKRRLECWRAVEDAIDAGEVRTGGVSNYGVKHLQELLASNPRIKPAINQVEIHPFNTRNDIASFCATHSITIEAYAPLARAMRMKHPTVVALAAKYNVQPAQVLVRWSLQHGYVPLPKSVRRDRIVTNADVQGWVLEDADVRSLDALDEYLVTDWDPTGVA